MVKHERSQRLILLGKKMTKAYRESFLSEEQKVLLEEELIWEGRAYFTGHNERYVKILVPKTEGMESGQLLNCRAERLLEINGEEVLLAI